MYTLFDSRPRLVAHPSGGLSAVQFEANCPYYPLLGNAVSYRAQALPLARKRGFGGSRPQSLREAFAEIFDVRQ